MTAKKLGAWSPAYIVAGYLTLFGSAYWDSMRGPLLPVLAKTLHIPFEQVSRFLSIGSIAAVLAVLLLGYAFRRWGEKRVGIGICGIALAAGVYAPFVDSYPSLLALGVIVGASLAMHGAICSIFTLIGTPLEWRSRMLAGNHVMYSLGSFMAPLVVTYGLGQGWTWTWLVAGGGVFFGLLGIFIIVAVPAAHGEAEEARGKETHKSFQHFIMLLFALYVVAEATSGTWLVTYLNGSVGMPMADASGLLSKAYLLMGATRLICFAFLKPRWERPLLWFSVAAPLVAHVFGRLGTPEAYIALGLFGPFYPIFLARISRILPSIWRSLTLKVILAIHLSLGLFHAIIGRLSDSVGIAGAYFVPPLVFIVVLVLLAIYFKWEARVSLTES